MPIFDNEVANTLPENSIPSPYLGSPAPYRSNINLNTSAGVDSNPEELQYKGATIEQLKDTNPVYKQSTFNSPFEILTAKELTDNKRYPIYKRGLDLENIYGEQQHWYSQLGNSVVKMGATAVGTFAQTFGTIPNAISAIKNGSWSDFSDPDGYESSIDTWLKNMEDKFPNFYSNYESKHPFLSIIQPTGMANFWGDKIFKNLGFTIGAIGGAMVQDVTIGALTGGVGVGPSAAGQMGKLSLYLGKIFSRTSDVEKVLDMAKTAGVVGEGLLDVAKIAQIAKGGQLLDKTATGIRYGIGLYSSAAAEAGIEARDGYNQIKTELISQYKIDHFGEDPKGQELDNITKYAEDGMNVRFGINMALLIPSNAIQFDGFLKAFGKTSTKALASSLTRKIGETGKIGLAEGSLDVFEKQIPKTISGKVWESVKPKLPMVFSEGVYEEGGQYATERGTYDYYTRKYKNLNNSVNKENWDTLNETLHSTLYGFQQQFGTDAGMENMVLGALTALITGGVTNIVDNKRGVGKNEQINSAINIVNKHGITNILEQKYDSTLNSVGILKEMDDAATTNDVFKYKNLKHDAFFNFVTSRLPLEMHDVTIEQLEMLKELKKEDFENRFGADFNESNIKTVSEYVENLIEKADKIKDTYDTLNKTFKNPFNNETENDHYTTFNKWKTDLAYYASVPNDLNSRIESINIDLLKIHPLLNSETILRIINNETLKSATEGHIDIFSSLLNTELGVNNNLSIEKIPDIIKYGIDINRINKLKQDIINKYKALSTREGFEKYFTEEEKIKEDKKTINISPEQKGSVINVKTSKGNREINVGEEYYLGSVQHADGSLGFPTLTILGKGDENGTIKIKDKNGIRDVSEKELEEYSLGKVSDIDKSENSSWYFRNIVQHPDTITFWNIGKKNNTDGFYPENKIPGKIRYNPETDKLIFGYTNRQGKFVTKEIGLDQFKFDPTKFKEGLYSLNHEQTKEDVNDINKRETSGKTKSDQASRRVNRLKILSDLYNEISSHQEVITNKIQSHKDTLNKIAITLASDKKITKQQLTALGVTTIKKLNTLKDSVEKEIIILTDQSDVLNTELSYIEKMKDNIENYSETGTEFLKNIENEIKVTTELKEQIQKSVDELTGISTGIQKLITKLVNVLQKTFPLDTFGYTDVIREYFDEINNQNFSHFQDVKDFIVDNSFLDNLEDREEYVSISNADLVDIKDRIDKLQEQYKEESSHLTAQEKVLDRFKVLVEKYREEKIQEKKIASQASKLTKSFTDQEIPEHEHPPYEVVNKKSDFNVVNATKPNPDNLEHQARTDRFGILWNRLKPEGRKKFKTIDITQNTEDQIDLKGLMEHLLREETNIYKRNLIVARVIVNSDSKLVDQEGKEITENFIGNALYQVLPQPNEKGHLVAKYNGNVESMFRNTTSEPVRDNLEKQYIVQRNQILESKVLQPMNDFYMSFGSPVYDYILNPDGTIKKDSNNKPIINYNTRTSVEDANLVTSEGMSESRLLEVVTLSEEKHEGTVSMHIPKGYTILRIPGSGLIKVFSRLLTNKESNTIFDVLEQLTKDLKNDVEDLSTSFNWLKSIVYWGIPRDANKNRLIDKTNSVYFENRKDEKGINIPTLIVGKDNYLFTPEGLLESKEGIIISLEKIYHNIDAKLVNNEAIDKKYTELTYINKEGKPRGNEWNNYQTYLLSNKNFDGIEKRTDVPLTTPLKAIKNDSDVNRKDFYIATSTDADDAIHSTLTEQSPVIPHVKLTTLIEFNKKVNTEIPSDKFNLSGEVNEITVPNLGKVNFTSDGKNLPKLIENDNLDSVVSKGIIKTKKDGKDVRDMLSSYIQSKIKEQLDVEKTSIQPAIEEVKEEITKPTIENVISGIMGNQGLSIMNADINSKGISIIKNTDKATLDQINKIKSDFEKLKEINPNKKLELIEENNSIIIKEIKEQLDTPIQSAIEEIPKVDVPLDIEAKKADIERRRQEELDANYQQDLGFALKNFPPNYLETISGKNFKKIFDNNHPEREKIIIDKINAKYNVELSNLTSNKPDTALNIPKRPDKKAFRMELAKSAKRFSPENWKDFETFLATTFPILPTYRVKNIIQRTNGKQAWGMFQNGAIYIYENAGIGTGYHEVFEGVWKMFATPEEKIDIISEFKNREGSYIDRWSKENIEYKNATPDQIKEEIAEEFIDYRLDGKLPERNVKHSVIGQLFHDLINFIKTFFTGKDAVNNTQKLFDKIGNGYYKEYIPYETKLSYANVGIIDIDRTDVYNDSEFRDSKEIPANQMGDIIQHLNYMTITTLTRSGESIFNIDELDKNALYDMLKDDLLERVNWMRYMHELNRDEGKTTPEEATRKINNMVDLLHNIQDQWKTIVETHIEYLKERNIVFDENEIALLNIAEDGIEKTEYMESNKIDSFKQMNASVKLMLGTLPIIDPSTGETKDSSVGGVICLPADQVNIQLLNELSDATDPDDMFIKLGNYGLKNANYKVLYNRIFGIPYQEGSIDVSNVNKSKLEIISEFWKSFKKQSPEYVIVFTLPSGETVTSNTVIKGASDVIKRDMLNNIIDRIKEGVNYFDYNTKTGTYKVSETLKYPSGDVKSYIDFLDKIGIDFSLYKAELTGKLLDNFKQYVTGIVKSFKDVDGIKIISEKSLGDMGGRLGELADMQAMFEHPELESTHYNLGRERVSTFMNPNVFSRIHNVLSTIKNRSELNTHKFRNFRYLLTDKFTEGSEILKRMFTEKSGDKVEGTENIMHPVLAEGLSNGITGRDREVSRLSFKERLIQDLNLNLAGIYANLVPGDAALEANVRMHKDSNPFISSANIDLGQQFDIFKRYLLSEIKMSREERLVAKDRDNNSLRFFKDILDKETYDKIMEDVESSPEEIYEKHSGKINSSIERFFKEERDEMMGLLTQYSILKSDEKDEYYLDRIWILKGKHVSLDAIKNEMYRMALNFAVTNIELHKLIYGDPYQYELELKRTKLFGSPKQELLHNSEKLNQAFDTVYNEGFEKDSIGWIDMNKEFFNTVTYNDVLGKNDLYGEILWKESDGACIVNLKANKVFGIRTNNWTNDNELQYKHDIGYQKLVQGLIKEGKTAEEIKKETIEFEKDNPNIADTYTPRKPSVAGNKESDRTYNSIVEDKMAQFVHSFRTLHLMNPDSNALELYNKMEKENIDYAIFASGRKEGQEIVHNIYDGEKLNQTPYTNETELANPDAPQGIVRVPFSIFGVQMDVPSKENAQTREGSQLRAEVVMNLVEGGVPLDFVPKNKELKYDEWKNSSYEDKMKSSLFSEMEHNRLVLRAKQEHGFQTLLKKLGIVKTNEGYNIENIEKLTKTLKDEIFKYSINDNILKSFKDFKQGNTLLEATPLYSQLRSIIYSIADKQVISTKISGRQLVQALSTLLESKRIKIETIKGKDAYTSDILKFYTDEDGKRFCQLGISRWFDSPLSDEELLDSWYEKDAKGNKTDKLTEEGEKVLSGIAFRIPTQNKNSIDVFTIGFFLPKELRDQVIVPSALVLKAGSDFDIDKLSVYLKNVFKDNQGNIKMVPFLGIGEEAKTKFAEMFDKGEFLTEAQQRQLDLELNVELGTGQLGSIILQRIFGDVMTDPESEYTKEFVEQITRDGIRETMIDKLYKESLENEYIQSLQTLTSHPLNFDRLTSPNSATVLEDISNDIVEQTGQRKTDYSSVGNLIKRSFMAKFRQELVMGKQFVAIAAVNQKGHAQRQRILTYINPERNITVKDKKWIGDGEIKFQKYNKETINGNPRAVFSLLKDAEGKNYISDINSGMIDGSVDINKNNWIIRLGIKLNTLSTWLLLIDLGVPIRSVSYFMNQPIINDFLRELEANDRKWLFDDRIYKDKLEVYTPQEQGIDVSIIPSEIELFNMLQHNQIGKKGSSMNNLQRAQQQFMLGEFLKYAKMAEHSFYVTQGSNYDTATFNDPLLIDQKYWQLERARNTIISSVDDLVNDSFAGDTKAHLDNIRKANSQVLTTDKVHTGNILFETLRPYFKLNSKDFLRVSHKAVNDLIDWTMQNDTGINKTLISILVGTKGKNSSVKDVLVYRDKVLKDPSHPLFNNTILNSIKLESGNRRGTINNLYIQGRDGKSYNQNLIIHGFEELKNELMNGTPQEQILYRRLLHLVVTQSGLTVSPISFTSLLPYEDFKTIYNDSISSLNNRNLDNFNIVNVFERNNATNPKIVPAVKAFTKLVDRWENFQKVGKKIWNIDREYLNDKLKLAISQGTLPMLIERDTQSQYGDSDIILYSYSDDVSSHKIAEMRKKSDYSYTHKVLMKRVYTTNTDGNIIPYIYTTKPDKKGKVYEKQLYKAINAWGDGIHANELYDKINPYDENSTIGQPSVFENGIDKVIKKDGTTAEVEDQTIMNILNEGKQLEEQTIPENAPINEILSNNNMNSSSLLDITDDFIKNNLKSKKYQSAAQGWYKLNLPSFLNNSKIEEQSIEYARELLKLINNNNLLSKDKYSLSTEFSYLLNKPIPYLRDIINRVGNIETKLLMSGELESKGGNNEARTLEFYNNLQTKSFSEIRNIIKFFAEYTLNPSFSLKKQDKESTIKLLNNFIDKYKHNTPINKILTEQKTDVSSNVKINIYAGTNENTELSNFAKRPFILNGGEFNSVEQFFQESKLAFTDSQYVDFNSNIHKQISESNNSVIIKRLGSQYKGFNTFKWDQASSKIIKTGLKASFEQNPEALNRLLATGNATLTHSQDKGKWGMEFPKLLMEVRNELNPSRGKTDDWQKEDNDCPVPF